MRRSVSLHVSLALLLCGLLTTAWADVKLPGVMGDHMVLQQEVAIPVWGWAEPGEKVTVTLGDQSKTSTACEAGKWSVTFEAMKAGGPYVLKVQGKNLVELKDVLVGEVWLCSGQSNMQWTVSSSANRDEEIAAGDYPKLRMFTVDRKTALEPQSTCGGSWQVASPQTVGGFSATAYFFGRELHKQLGVPVGLINSSWGGTPIEAWTSQKDQEAVPELAAKVESHRKAVQSFDPENAKKQYEKQLADWERTTKAKGWSKNLPRKPGLPQNPGLSPHGPGSLYNGMIAPLAPYFIRGAIWYQGESNAGNAKIYGLQMKTMITNWRRDWKQGDFAFLSVQLPNFMAPQQSPSEPVAGWPLLREEFVKTLALPNTGMAITIDIGEAKNIHPKNKQDVGKRLAQWALAKNYGKDCVASGPLYKSMQKQGDKIVLQFDYADGGLVVHGGDKLKGFAIAGEDKKFVWADAKIEGNSVAVSSAEVKSPSAVRYAWANNPDCNLFNKAGLPASPFRTDDWTDEAPAKK